MHSRSTWLYKALLKEDYHRERIRLPKARETLREIANQSISKFPLRTLGTNDLGIPFTLSEEAREAHVHILGSPGEGKSKFLELLVLDDIRNGYGATVIDPSDNGDTIYKILNHCIKIGFEKICLIDLHDIHRYKVVPTINPLHHKAPTSAIVGNIMDTLRVLWRTQDFAYTARLQKYLPAILATLHSANAALQDAIYFTDFDNPFYQARRNQMLESLHPYDHHRVSLERVFKRHNIFTQEFESSVRRLEPVFDNSLRMVFGSLYHPINFASLIGQGYLILVNLDPEGLYGHEHQRLLGTFAINEELYAIGRLYYRGWRKFHNIYIDEVGDYATAKIAHVLDKKRKLGVRLTMAHQGFDQITDNTVRASIEGRTKIKVLFNTASREDRDRMLRMMYGGDLTDREVSYTLAQLKKQHAAIKNNKKPAEIVKIRDIHTPQISPQVIKAFKQKIYSQPWYLPPEAIRAEINSRFATTQIPKLTRRYNRGQSQSHDIGVPKTGKGGNRSTTGKARPTFTRETAPPTEENREGTRTAEGVRISWDVQPDHADTKQAKTKRRGQAKQGDKHTGGESKS